QRLLGIGPATGALAISRLGYAAGRPIEWRHTVIRGDRFCLLAEFSVRTGYRLAADRQFPAGPGAAARGHGPPPARREPLPRPAARPDAQRRAGLVMGRPAAATCWSATPPARFGRSSPGTPEAASGASLDTAYHRRHRSTARRGWCEDSRGPRFG